MQLPLQVTFHGITPSEAIQRYVERRAEKLELMARNIVRCHVVIEAPHRHSREGRRYAVRIDVCMPGREVAISRELGDSELDAYAAIDEAFDEAKRRLREAVDVRRGDVKSHEGNALHGRVAKLFSYEGYGFIETETGDEIYFHRNSVLNGAFGRLERGDRVRFIEEEGDDGMHATSVALVG
jgi:ribosomal subunit interface protein